MRAFLAVLCAVGLALAGSTAALAHEARKVGAFDVECGWQNEPPTVGQMNSILFNAAKSGTPVTDGKLTVTATFGGKTSSPLDLVPNDETPGRYLAAFIPTEPGAYTFHITGTLGGTKFDQTFAPGKGVEEAGSAADLEFPTKQPTGAELAAKITRLTDRLATVTSSADNAKTLGLVGVIVGGLGLLVGLASLMRRRKTAA